ncbi:hypothetical protein [Mucisphaera sp.]|uniref:hypothetical protein n=1 Tax=Mucisphaera sp. TaxID=2913024 RepID=UPI003D0B1890
MSQPPTPTSTAPKRAVIGLSVILAVAAALAIVVFVNFIAYRQFLRFDFTQTGRYSLSEQTQRVLADLDTQHQIVGRFRTDTEPTQQLADLLNEYDLRSDRIDLQMIIPGRDVVALDNFNNTLKERYVEKLEPAQQAIDSALTRIDAILTGLTPPIAELATALEDDTLRGRNADQLRQLVNVMRLLPSSWSEQASAWRDQMEEPLPPLEAIRSQLSGSLREIEQSILVAANAWLDDAGSDSSLPPAIRDASLRAAAQTGRFRAAAETITGELDQLAGLDEYDQLTQDLQRESVVVLSPDKARVIPIDQMIQATLPDEAQDQTQYRFLAEEQLTGALISLGLEQQPLAVFLALGPGRPAIGARGDYAHVASRLRSADFELIEWNPSGGIAPTGQRLPPTPPPTVESGRPAVWIVLPASPPDPRNPMAGGATAAAKQQAASLLQQRLEAGDGVMMMLANDPGARFGTTDPLADLAASRGLQARTDQIILSEIPQGERQNRASTYQELRQWPDDNPVSRALAGLPGIVMQASPITLLPQDTAASDGDQTEPGTEASETTDPQPEAAPATYTTSIIAQVSGPRLWATAEAAAAGSLEEVPFDPALAAPDFVVGAASQPDQADGGRLIVVTDPVWATDQITTYGVIPALGMASVGFPEFALYPANAELFVNSVFWLSEMDHLIAASARTQRVPRIGDLSAETLTAYQLGLLLGLPTLILAMGVSMHLIRRSG